MSKQPITVYFSDNGVADIYRLTQEQIQVFQDNDWDGIEKFAIPIDTHDEGYAPGWLIKLAELYGFEVDSI